MAKNLAALQKIIKKEELPRKERMVAVLSDLTEALDTRADVEDMLEVFNYVLSLAQATQQFTEEELNKLRQITQDTLEDLEQKNVELQDTLRSEITLLSKDLQERIDKKLNTIKQPEDGYTPQKGVDYFDGEPGKDADPEAIANLVLAEINELLDGLENTNAKIEERIKALEERPVGRGGGGTSAVGVAQAFKYIAHTEQPSGDIDGANTDYTVQNNIWWIAGFTINGEQVAELPNFTFSGKTITFSTAIPAGYSGKDFEVKYIGV